MERTLEQNRQGGHTLLNLLISMAIMAGVLMFFFQTITVMFDAKTLVNQTNDVSYITRLLSRKIDCVNSLEITSATPLPLNCASYPNVTLRDKSGREFRRFAKWLLASKCENNELIVAGTRLGRNRLQRKEWNKMQTSKKFQVGQDLMGGRTELCKEYFTGNSCPRNKKIFMQGGTDYHAATGYELKLSNPGTPAHLPNVELVVPYNGIYRVDYKIDTSQPHVDPVQSPTEVGAGFAQITINNQAKWMAYGEWPLSAHSWGGSLMGHAFRDLKKGDILQVRFETKYVDHMNIKAVSLNLELIECEE